MASGKALMSTVLEQSKTISLLQCKKKNRLPTGTQVDVGTKQYHTMQPATESKRVEREREREREREISDHEMENDSPESKRPNLRTSPQKCK